MKETEGPEDTRAPSRYERMQTLKSLIKDATFLLASRSIEIKAAKWDTEESTEGRLLGIPLGKVFRQHHEQRGYDVSNEYHNRQNGIFTSPPKHIYESIPGMKELTERFLAESDELIKKGIKGFQKEFEDLDKL